MENKITVGVVQQMNSGEISSNLEKLKKNISILAEKGAKLIVLPELHNTLYFCKTEDTDSFDLAESIPGPSTEIFGMLAKQHQVVLVCSLFEKRAPGIYHNTAVIFEKDGSIAGTYRKMHVPDDPGYYEKFYFTPGDQGFEPVSTSLGKLGVLVCWDQWYPEAARIMALKGATMLIYPTAIGWDPADSQDEKQRQLEAWVTVQKSHAIANGIPVVSANRTGFEADDSGITPGADFWGNSFVCGPQGELLNANLNIKEENILAEIDISKSETVRRIWPFFRDRRIDAYGEIIKRYID